MEDLFGKRLLVLGGSIWKDAIKQYADEKGITLISAGLYPAGTDDIADEIYRIDTTNAALMKPFIKEKHIDGVYLGGSELIISSACQYLHEIGLPCFCTPEQWTFLMNKKEFKRLCIQFDLPVVSEYHDKKTIEYPVVVKPADGCGSSGLTIVRKEEDLDTAVNLAKQISTTGSVIIEKFVKNVGYCIFYTFINGRAVFSGMEAKLPVYYEKQKSYVGGLYYFTDKRTEQFRAKYEQRLERLFSSLGIQTGSLWIEVFYDNGRYYFNEVGFRAGGEVSQYPVNYYTGINQVAQDIYYSLTGDNKQIESKSLVKRKAKENYAIYPVHINSGKISSIKGIRELEDNPLVSKVFMTKKEGDTVKDTGTFSQIVSLVHFYYEKLDDIEQMIQMVNNTLEINDDKNNRMISPKLYESVNGYSTMIYDGGGV